MNLAYGDMTLLAMWKDKAIESNDDLSGVAGLQPQANKAYAHSLESTIWDIFLPKIKKNIQPGLSILIWHIWVSGVAGEAPYSRAA